jgi:protein-S-isoprenylcysteine O-methyltransferase Ste14
MSLLTISRILMLCLLINEAFVMGRTSPEDRKRLALPPFMPLVLVLLIAPFFVALDLPVWLAVLAIVLQSVGLFVEIYSEIQLTRAQSFGIVEDKGTQPQTTGFYRWLEHPIYIGIMLQMIGWSLWMPLTLVAAGLNFIAVRRMVHNERQYLVTNLKFAHHGLDTRLWN